jgi:hypothetical protein
MQGILYESASILPFAFITILLGGLAAWQMGRAIAQTWRPYLIVPIYAFLLTLAVRFIHFALFEGKLLSFQFFIADFVMLLIAGSIGWRMMRAKQMGTQYSFAYETSNLLNWKRKS